MVFPVRQPSFCDKGINDGAAAVVLASSNYIESHSLTAMANIVSWAQSGVDPAVMGVGPIEAVQKAVGSGMFKLHHLL